MPVKSPLLSSSSVASVFFSTMLRTHCATEVWSLCKSAVAGCRRCFVLPLELLLLRFCECGDERRGVDCLVLLLLLLLPPVMLTLLPCCCMRGVNGRVLVLLCCSSWVCSTVVVVVVALFTAPVAVVVLLGIAALFALVASVACCCCMRLVTFLVENTTCCRWFFFMFCVRATKTQAFVCAQPLQYGAEWSAKCVVQCAESCSLLPLVPCA